MEADWGRWRRQPETRLFLNKMQEHFQGVRHWHRQGLTEVPVLQGQMQVLEWAFDFISNGQISDDEQ